MLFYETYGKGSPEQELSPRYALLAEDSVVQAVPEHPKKENVFCLSNTYGDVYLFQVEWFRQVPQDTHFVITIFNCGRVSSACR